MLLLLALLWFSAWAGTLTVDVLDVGQGDSILLRTPAGKAVLVDAGEATAHVSNQLAAMGITALDLAVATHPHSDHIGGMTNVLLSVPTKLFIDNGLPHTTGTYNTLMRTVEAQKIPYKTAVVGQIYKLDDGILLKVLNPTGVPLRGTRSDLNANSVVIRLEHGKDCMMLSGDAEAETEQGLLARGLTPCDVLKVAHHGSEYATSPELIAALKPKIAVISVGAGNSYGHPGKATMARLAAAGAKIYRTDLDGDVRLLSSGKGWTVRTRVVPGPVGKAVPVKAMALAPAAPAEGSDAESSAPAEATADAAGCLYVASSSSQIYHLSSCGTARRISPATRICYTTRAAAETDGRRPAVDCKP